MSRIRSSFVVLLAVAGLVLALDYATFAATGGSLVLGRSNSADRTTTLTTTGTGPALSLGARSGRPPLAVSSRGRVIRLNADQVDGREAASLANTTRRYQLAASETTYYPPTARFVLPAVPPGYYQASLNTSLLATQVTNVQCVLLVGIRPYGGQLTPFTGIYYAALSASALVQIRSAGERLAVACAAENGGGAVAFAEPLRVTLAPTEVVASGAIQPVS